MPFHVEDFSFKVVGSSGSGSDYWLSVRTDFNIYFNFSFDTERVLIDTKIQHCQSISHGAVQLMYLRALNILSV